MKQMDADKKYIINNLKTCSITYIAYTKETSRNE